MKHKKNPAIKAMAYVQKWKEGQSDVALEEWRYIRDHFDEFEYTTDADRLSDFKCVLSAGYVVLTLAGEWSECMQLMDQALSDPQFMRDSKMVPVVCEHKSIAYLHMGQEELALQSYLDEVPVPKTLFQRSAAYIMGATLLSAVKAQAGNDQKPISDLALSFSRQIFTRYKPEYETPELLSNSELPRPSWAEVHAILAEYTMK